MEMIHRKGMELPIKIIVVLIIMIIILAVMVLWFGKSTAQGQSSTNCYMAFSDECGRFKLAGGCDEGSTVRASDYFNKSVDTNCYPSADAAKNACCSS